MMNYALSLAIVGEAESGYVHRTNGPFKGPIYYHRHYRFKIVVIGLLLGFLPPRCGPHHTPCPIIKICLFTETKTIPGTKRLDCLVLKVVALVYMVN